VNIVKQTYASLLIVAFLVFIMLPVALPSGVLAQTSGYTIDKVDHQVHVMYSGQLAIAETIHVSGQVTDGFMIGLPSQYSADVLNAIAYDDTNIFQINLGVQLGDHSGFYGASVNFNGSTPNAFTVAFILSNSLVVEQGSGAYNVNFPAYPSLTQDVASVDCSITFPSIPSIITIAKDDGNIDTATYTKTNLAAYTYSLASAVVQLSTGTIELSTITGLNRQINIDSTGKVTVSDNYRIVSDSSLLSSYALNLPPTSTNIQIKDQFGVISSTLGISDSMIVANATLVTFLSQGQSTVLTAQYNLPSASLQGGNYVLKDFKLFPDFNYYVSEATSTFTPPEGATIVTPTATELDSAATLTRQTYQDTLAVTKESLSFVDYLAPQQNNIQLAFNYNPVWASFRPTFWAALLAVVGCFAVFFIRRRQPSEETYAEKTERLTTPQATSSMQQTKGAEIMTTHPVTAETIHEFVDAYEDKKQLKAELKSMDAKAQKGKIPRRQYKVQRASIEDRLVGIERSIGKTKKSFIASPGAYADLVKQLDLAETDLAEAEENIKNLDSRQNRGEISLEVYKRNIGDYQKQRDKAESAINGILLRLREKIR
jgi:hypothetical protein